MSILFTKLTPEANVQKKKKTINNGDASNTPWHKTHAQLPYSINEGQDQSEHCKLGKSDGDDFINIFFP